MPLYERMKMLGLVGSDDEKQSRNTSDIKSQSASNGAITTDSTEQSDADVSEAVAAAFRRCQKKKPMLVMDDESDDLAESDTEYDASGESDITGDMASMPDFDGAQSEDEMREEARVRRVIHKGKETMALLGTAEVLRRQSNGGTAHSRRGAADTTVKIPAKFVPLAYPTGDVNVGAGFHVLGFTKGKRVYRLESEHISRLQSTVVKTGVGFCYLDLASMLPPKVVQVPAESLATTPATPPSTPPNASHAATTQLNTPISSMSLETSPSSPRSVTSQPQPPLQVQPHLHVNDAFAIRPSALGGLGAFALRDLCRGEHILVEQPLLRTTLFHMPRELESLAPEKRAQFDALTGHHPDPHASVAEQIWTANTFEAGGMEAIFAVASRFNHACTPRNNIGYHYDRRKDVLIMSTIKKIAAGTELVITYGKSPSELFLRFGFRCVCGACTGFTESMSRQQQLRNWSA